MSAKGPEGNALFERLRHGRFQGVLAPEILVTRAHCRERHPDTLPHALVEFCNWCLRDAALLREEVQADAWPIYYSSLYLGQVANGGHGQFAGDTGMDPFVVNAVERGLDLLELRDLSKIFGQFTSALLNDANLKASVMQGGGFGDIPPIVDALDTAFFASVDRDVFALRASAWLRRNPHVVAVTPREKKVREARIVAANALLAQRLGAATRARPREAILERVWRFWDLTGLRRPGASGHVHLRRRFAALPPEWPLLLDAELTSLRQRFDVALEDDAFQIDAVIAEYRDVHRRYELHAKPRWSHDISFLGGKLLLAGEKLGRVDLLGQAADAFGQAIAAAGSQGTAGSTYEWLSLGEALVAAARLDDAAVPGLTEALGAFDRAIANSGAQADLSGRWGLELACLGRAEALILLATGEDCAEHLAAARDLLDEVRDPATYPGKQRNAAAYAELLTLLPGTEDSEGERRRARRRLDVAIAREQDNDGAVWTSLGRLDRLRRLRADARLADAGSSRLRQRVK